MTTGSVSEGTLASATPGAPRRYRGVSWSGADSLIKVTAPHTVLLSNGKTKVFNRTRWAESPPALEPPKAISALELVSEALRLRDQIEEAASREARTLPYSPGWKSERLPKRARLAENGYSKSWTVLMSTASTFRSRAITVPCYGTPTVYTKDTMDWHGFPGYSAPSQYLYYTANDQIKLVNKLREKIQGSEFNPAVFLGEGHQALGMIASSALRISKSLYALKRGDVRGAAMALSVSAGRDPKFIRPDRLKALSLEANNLRRGAVLDAVARSMGITQEQASAAALALRARGRKFPKGISRREFLRQSREARKTIQMHFHAPKEFSAWWLEMAYGWIPLLKDAEEGAKFLAHRLNSPLQQTYRVSFSNQTAHKKTYVWPDCPGNKSSIGLGSKTYRVGIIARVREKPNLPLLTGLTHLESVAWELMPWSFVIDWFIPIGDYLTARGFAQGLNGTFITTVKRSGKAFRPQGDFMLHDDTTGSNYAEFGDITRTVSSSLLVRMPVTKPLNKALSWRHCVNAVALLLSGHGGQGYR